MKIFKVINNNVLSAYDDREQEVVLMGRGIGFKAKPGDSIDESRVEKVFCIENRTLSRQFQELLSNMPLIHMQISADIIAYAKNECKLKLNQSIYVALTDHINSAIERYRQGIRLENALLWEIRQFYYQEYLVGEYALRLFGERMDIHFPEDEAGFIALHFVNAVYDTGIRDMYAITNMLQKSLAIVKEEFGGGLDESTVHYERFVTHLKFLAKRLYRKELLCEEDTEFMRQIERRYQREFGCAQKIAEAIEKEYGSRITEEEELYLTIHLRRVLLKNDSSESE